MRTFAILNNSKLNVQKGTVSASTLSISDSVVNIASGAKLNLTSSNTFSATDITNITVVASEYTLSLAAGEGMLIVVD